MSATRGLAGLTSPPPSATPLLSPTSKNVQRRRSRSFSGWNASERTQFPSIIDDTAPVFRVRRTVDKALPPLTAPPSVPLVSPTRRRFESFNIFRSDSVQKHATPKTATHLVYKPSRSRGKNGIYSPTTPGFKTPFTSTFPVLRSSGDSDYAPTVHSQEQLNVSVPEPAPENKDLPPAVNALKESPTTMQRLVQGIKNIPAKLSPKSPSIRRAAQFFIRSPNTSPESERPPISNPIPKPEPVVLRFSYDWEKRRLTGLENWRELCPTSTADPFHDMQIFDTAEVMGDPHKEPELRQPILDKIRQRFGEVIGSTVHELPRSFRLEVMTSEQTPPNTANPVISPPFNVTHTLAVTSDPKTGRLEGLPSAWGGNDAAETTQRTKFTRSLIISDVISYSSLSRYMRPAPPPRPLPAPAVPAIPLVAGAADVPLASAPIISTPVPREPSNQQPKKGVARKPVPALGPGFPETSARLNHRRNPSQGVLPTSPTPPSRPRGVTVSGVPGDTTSSLHTWKPLPPLPPE